MLVPDAQSLLARHAAPPPVAQATTDTGTTTAGTEYIADDEQTTGAQQAANANKVPFIAFRGISDTSAVGNLWPFEWLVYQQLAADNSSTAARLWIQRWDQH
jgi:nucleoside phosphorylase